MKNRQKKKLMKAKFTTVCSKTRLKDIRIFVGEQIEKISLNEKLKRQIILAVDEAAANAIIHGNNCDEKKSISIEIQVNDKKLSVAISDIGKLNLPIIEHTGKGVHDLVKEKKKGGMGLKLMHSIMDKVQYFHRGKGNVCLMTKILSSRGQLTIF